MVYIVSSIIALRSVLYIADRGCCDTGVREGVAVSKVLALDLT